MVMNALNYKEKPETRGRKQSMTFKSIDWFVRARRILSNLLLSLKRNLK